MTTAEWYERKPRPNYVHSMFWFLFGNGGALIAVVMPVMILVMGILGPLHLVPYWWSMSRATFAWVLGNPLVKLFLVVVIFFAFWHTLHRMIFVLVEVGLKSFKRPLEIAAYAFTVLITIAAAGLIFTTP